MSSCRLLLAGAGLALITAAMPAGASPAAASPTNGEIANEIYTLKEQAAGLQARNQEILKTLDQLRQSLQAKLPADAPPAPTFIPTAPSGPPDLKAAAAALHPPDALNLDGMPAEGDPNAAVAILEYTDFEDPDAGAYAQGAFAQIEKNYVKTGKVRYIHQDFTQPWHPNATVAARAARCSGQQGKFWEMRDSLFSNQDALGQEADIARAQTLGENVDNFRECLQGNRFSTEVINSVMLGQRFGVTLAPTLFIGSYDKATNSMQIRKTEVGAQSYDTVKADIDAQLAAARK
jgi:protein-disulfide isomerase